jgi:hypothetical protein
MTVVTLTFVGNDIEAEILCGLLRVNGIECAHRKSNVAAAINTGMGGMGGPTEVLVGSSDLEAARALLPKE